MIKSEIVKINKIENNSRRGNTNGKRKQEKETKRV